MIKQTYFQLLSIPEAALSSTGIKISTFLRKGYESVDRNGLLTDSVDIFSNS